MTTWNAVKTYTEILFETNSDGQNPGKIAKITMNDAATHNAFTPKMVAEMIEAFTIARDDAKIGVIIMTGAGDQAFSSGGNQKVRGNGGYVGDDGIPRLNVLDLQRLMRIIPKPIIAMVKGWSIGGGNVLQLVADLTVAADNAKFGQTGPMVGSFDAGYGSGYLARVIGHKRAKEVWFLNHFYTADEAYQMNWINKVVPLAEVEDATIEWADELLTKSPTALRFIKAAMNADTDGLAGLQQFAGDATMLYYTSDEAKEGRDAFKEKRNPDFEQYPKFP
ncbi:1,4-dihydroxy-2-naphthoyl-CoA synthase [Leuconostoc miyukkimchii]|uniref:1,4-dihydroxy-2-naphthoyl-CoA synthase n=1 Tax=Leuconostoc miyukkimchii TaxID=910540 RepID=UPI001C7CBB23|nr:1,4-dihydroxy-2-naphthoyl-CoA synthase [Leuconostoc miyukkimchii]